MNVRKMAGMAIAVILLAAGAANADIAIRDSSTLTTVSVQVPLVLGYSDQDKLNLDTLKNWYDDVNNNSVHDPGEPFAATAQGGWSRPVQAWDNSCWLASGVNMLKQLGKISDANALYMDYALNGVASPSGTLTWDDGGLQEYVVQQWGNQHPAQAVDLQVVVLTKSNTVQFVDGHFAWEDVNIRSAVGTYLASGYEVGIGMWPLYAGSVHESGHALTMQGVPAQSSPPNGTFSVTDSDRDADWTQSGDLNTYADWTYGPTAYEGHNYYAWFNDFYSGNWSYWPDGDVGYVVAIIPEPATLSLLALGGLMALVRRRRSA